MAKTRKRHKKIGGNPNMLIYASLIKNKKNIEIHKFKAFLDETKQPLMQLYDFDGDGIQYTINEYALIHNSDIEIQLLFNNYQANLEHIVQYNIFDGRKLNILEAYILDSKIILNVQYILEQIETTNNYQSLFRYFTPEIQVPTVLMCAVEASKYKNSIYSNAIYQSIIGVYTKPKIYSILSKNNSPEIVSQLFQFATMFNKQDFMVSIYMFLIKEDIHSGFNLIFDADNITNILLHDDQSMYKTVISLMNYSDENVVKEILMDYANQKYNEQEKNENGNSILEYLKLYKLELTKDAKTLFEKLGKYAVENIFLPENDKRVRIIIICHGTTIDDSKKQIEFPFHKLCFFVEKGEKLRNNCIVSRSVEELVCVGNYDKNLRCTESYDNKIIIDNMVFSFENKTILDRNNKTTGFYICENNKVVKLNIVGLNNSYISLETLVDACNDICTQNEISVSNVNLMIFACRGTDKIRNIYPEPTATV